MEYGVPRDLFKRHGERGYCSVGHMGAGSDGAGGFVGFIAGGILDMLAAGW